MSVGSAIFSVMRIGRIFFLSPWFLSLIPAVIVILLIHNNFQRYIFEIESSAVVEGYRIYSDLDNDGTSEMIYAVSDPNATSIAVSSRNGVIDQWNFSGTLDFLYKKSLIITGDSDNDRMSEIYFFTLSSDSIILHCIHDIRSSGLPTANRLIAVAGKGIKVPDPFIIPGEMDDLDGDGLKELIFGIGTGFSRYPRNVFAYYISKDSLAESPESSYYIWKIFQTDITGDGKREIIPYGYAASNVSPDEAEVHDCSAFLIALDQDLRYLFKPIGMGGRYSKITPFENLSDGQKSLGFLFNGVSSKTFSTAYYVNEEGIITDSIPLRFYAIDCINTTFRKRPMYLLQVPARGIGLYDPDFSEKKTERLPDEYEVAQEDLDSDGRKEIIIIYKREILVFREGLQNRVSVPFPLAGNGDYLLSFNSQQGTEKRISYQTGRNHYILKYGRNPFWPYYYLFYAAVYLGFLGFALLIKSIQRNQLEKKYENEKKISQLQLALVRNQLDPHFTLNAINSIIYSVENSDRKLAGEQLRRFAGLYRNLLLRAGMNQITLEEEVDFCRDYLSLEKNRHGDKFCYEITINEDVNRKILVPKFMIQIHVENAIKHGLAPLKSGGMLDVKIRNEGNELIIEISDNGIGRQKAAEMKGGSTGKGLKVMDELYRIYNKYYDEKIGSEITDLFDRDGTPSGTRVLIKICTQNEKK